MKRAKNQTEKVALALAEAKKAAAGGHVFKASDLPRSFHETLLVGRWLLKIHAGWAALVTPESKNGDSIPYYSNYWEFVRKYLSERLGRNYALSAMASLDVHVDSLSIPRQLGIHAGKTTQAIVDLPFGTSMAIYHDPALAQNPAVEVGGLMVMPLELALSKIPASSFRTPRPELVAAIATVRNIPELTRHLLADRATQAAGRIVSALRECGKEKEAVQIEGTFASAGVAMGSGDDIQKGAFWIGSSRPSSAIGARIKSLWQTMSSQLPSGHPPQVSGHDFRREPFERILERLEDIYAEDAYNSLSIEGYQVTDALIHRVASGEWNESENKDDRNESNALAARGYFEAFESVKETLRKLHNGQDVVTTLENDLHQWRSSLFGPTARAGIIPADALAGYRNKPVFIRGSMHVPPPHEKLMDAMDSLFEAMKEEKDPWKRAVLGHYIFVNIHPFPDGNGRVGRFLMNSLMIAGGFPWTVVRVSQRDAYMAALERASTAGDIRLFSSFLAQELQSGGKEDDRPKRSDKEGDDTSLNTNNQLRQVSLTQLTSPPSNHPASAECSPPGCSDGPTKPRKCAKHR